jgi:hypothetical protein
LKSEPRILVLLGAMLALGGCGTTVSPGASVQASAPASQPSQAEVGAVICKVAPKAFDSSHIDLTGVWAGDDGGIYYLRQLGSSLWWNGMSDRAGSPSNLGNEWNNVGRGVINGLQIDVEWADVRGRDISDGTLNLKIQDDGTGNVQIVTVHAEGGFGNKVWTPCLDVELQVADYIRTYGGAASQYADILALEACQDLVHLNDSVTTTLNTAEAGSAEFRAALGYSNAISDREFELKC